MARLLPSLAHSGRVCSSLVHFREPLMKLNFWQLIGVALLVGGAALLIYREMNKTPAPVNNPAATTRPSK
jgi:hypothetical protein